MYIFLVILLLVFCVLLMLAEVFLLPGFGIAGIAGLASLAGAAGIAYCYISSTAGYIVLTAGAVLIILAIIAFFRSRAIRKMALDTTIDSSVSLADPGKKIQNLEKEAGIEKKETE
ncbi:MAG: hypothetical protein IJ581_04000 [Paludibacteraceae bacterium]|nr:hypothetical protein [Paludibacteraceae bacterium]